MKKLFAFVLFTTLVFAQNASGSGGLDEWIGDYSFEEFAPPNQVMEYSISIYKQSGQYFARIEIDGFQTMKRKLARLSGDAKRVDLLFVDNLEDDLEYNPDYWQAGDVFLTFSKSGSDIYTTWGKWTAMLESNEAPGKYFEKK